MASAELSRRIGKVVGYPPLSEQGDRQRREFHEALLESANRKLSEQVAELAAQAPEPGQLVDAHAISVLTGMSERWVYDHADDLGAIRAGGGVRPRLRFDPDLVRAKLAQRNGDVPSPQAPAPTPRRLPPAELLPVKGRTA